MVSILRDRRLQQLFLFKGTQIERQRLEYWLSAELVESLEQGNLTDLLRTCARFIRFTKESPQCIEGFLRMYLKQWDGKKNRKSIFELLVSIVPGNLEGMTLRWKGIKDRISWGDYGAFEGTFREGGSGVRKWFVSVLYAFVGALGECLWGQFSRWIGSVATVIAISNKKLIIRLMFGTKVVNTELHKALPAVASHVDQLGVQALQVPLCPSSFSFSPSLSPVSSSSYTH